MRRDMDLIRELLLKLENIERPHGFCSFHASAPETSVADFSHDEIDAHICMLFDAAYIQSGTDVRGGMDGSWYLQSLTWEGRDFLDSVRDVETWKRTKSAAKSAGTWTAKLLAEVGKAIAKAELAKHLGMPL